MVKSAPVLPRNIITDMDGECRHTHEGEDKFHIVHPDTKWEAAVEHGEAIGLGTRAYELIFIK